MNPYQYEVTCTVCGGPGMAHVRSRGGEWLGHIFTHRDPLVCVDYIAAKKEREEYEREQANVVAEGAGI